MAARIFPRNFANRSVQTIRFAASSSSVTNSTPLAVPGCCLTSRPATSKALSRRSDPNS